MNYFSSFFIYLFILFTPFLCRRQQQLLYAEYTMNKCMAKKENHLKNSTLII